MSGGHPSADMDEGVGRPPPTPSGSDGTQGKDVADAEAPHDVQLFRPY